MQTCKLRSHDLNLYIFFNTVKLQTVKQVATKAKFLLLRAHASESRHFFQKFLNQSQIFRNKCQDERID